MDQVVGMVLCPAVTVTSVVMKMIMTFMSQSDLPEICADMYVIREHSVLLDDVMLH